MIEQIRRVALGMFFLFALMFVNLNYLQVVRADALSENPANARGLIREYANERGRIVVGSGQQATPIAESVGTDDRLEYLRRYSSPELYAHVTGYYSFVYGRAELEQSYNEFLVGASPEVFVRNLADLLAGRTRVGDTVRTTIVPAVQQAAREALGDQVGAVVALDPQTGAVLALYSSPSYDPNVLSSHDGGAIREAWERFETAAVDPRLNRTIRETYPPGSVFKLVTAAAALESGIQPDTTFPDPVEQDLPLTTSTIRNFGRGTCNGGEPITLSRALQVSCNTTFAQIGLRVGPAALIEQSEAFGLNRDWDFDLDRVATSRIPKELDEPATAQSAIGQRDVRVTPMQVAMITAAIANDGTMMTPQLVSQVEDNAGRVISTNRPDPLSFGPLQPVRPIGRDTAAALQEMMAGVVSDGSGTAAQIGGVEVAGKTGTAQTGPGEPPTVWFTGFAPVDEPRVAVAVVIDRGGRGGEDATGGSVAAPMARAVMQAALDAAPAEDEQDE
jgi:peptidoglycan glycosyltransferase